MTFVITGATMNRVRYGLAVERETVAPGIVVFRAAGEMDLAYQSDLDEALDAALHEAERALVIDLSQLSFMDSTGIHGLVRARKTMEARGVPLMLAVSETSLRTLDAAGLQGVFTIVPSVVAALDALGVDGASAHQEQAADRGSISP